jgi:transcriptional regulator CtsR
MAQLSDSIERFIKELMEEEEQSIFAETSWRNISAARRLRSTTCWRPGFQ